MRARQAIPCILIADAEPYLCRVFEAKLIRENAFRVVAVSRGEEAVQAAIEHSFDVLVWDVRLGTGESTGTLAPLRALCPDAVLLLTTTDDRPTASPYLDSLDVGEVLIKPFGLETLVTRIRAALLDPPAVSRSTCIDLARVGQQIQLSSPGGRCLTRILSADQDRFRVVGAPRVETPADFAPGRSVQVAVKGMDGLYRFHSRIARFREQPVASWELVMPGTIHREQRRKHPRHPIRLPATLQQGRPGAPADPGLPALKPRGVSPAVSLQGMTADLSLGGCSLVAEQWLPVGTIVAFALHPEAGAEISGRGCILRMEPLIGALPAPARYRLAMSFDEIEDTARHRLRELL
ncbi:MAG TPA: PilZ domain-containing protein, partial [Chthonomonadaceae bacterium]|nr:PilZ domain-containing protein [Chthonomonadaceae bacterium]